MTRLPVLAAILFLASPGHAATIHVPGDQPTIQAGINAAAANDVVLVAPGTYLEHIVLKSDIALVSSTGPSVTIIDGRASATVIYANAVSHTSVVGFTIQNGQGSYGGTGTHGGGIALVGCGPSVEVMGNLIRQNTAWDGGGMGVWSGNGPTITNNIFDSNVSVAQGPSSYGVGAAIFLDNAGTPVIMGNVFQNNHCDRGASAIHCFNASAPLIDHNVILGNQCADINPPSGACIVARNAATISNNLIAYNVGCRAFWFGNNLNGNPSVENTIIAFNDFTLLAECHSSSNPSFSCTDIHGNSGGDWTGCVASFLGVNGNISEDPLFCDVSSDDFHLQSDSPCAPANSAGCGLIGALDVGCGPIAVEEVSWTGIKGRYR